MYTISREDISDSDFAGLRLQKKIVEVGDYLFVFSAMHRRCHSFYVRAKVDEVNYIWSAPGMPTVWHYRKEDEEVFTHEIEETTEGGWNKHRSFGLEEFLQLKETHGFKLVNQFPWTDWPIGHATYLGTDGFFTLEEARRAYGRFSKRKLGRRVDRYIKDVFGFNQGDVDFESYRRRAYV